MTTTTLAELKKEHKRIKAQAEQDMWDHSGAGAEFLAFLWWSFFIGAGLISVLLCGCSTSFNYPNGTRAANIQSNVTDFAFQGGGITVAAKRIDNATPTYVGLAGATDLTGAVAGGAFAIAAPGVNGATRAAVLLAPHVTPRYQKSAPRAPAQVVTP